MNGQIAWIDPTLFNYNPLNYDPLKLTDGIAFEGDIGADWDIRKKQCPSHLGISEAKDGQS